MNVESQTSNILTSEGSIFNFAYPSPFSIIRSGMRSISSSCLILMMFCTVLFSQKFSRMNWAFVAEQEFGYLRPEPF